MKITRIIISSPVCAHMKANTVIWIGVCNEGRQRWHSNKDRWHISTCFHCTCTANVRFPDKWRTAKLTCRPGVCQCAHKKAGLKSFSFSSHSYKQTEASHKDKGSAAGTSVPVMGPVRPPTAHHQVAIVCDCYCPSICTISWQLENISTSEERASFSPSFFLLQWIRARQLEFFFHITLLSAFSVTPLLWGGVPAPLSPAVRPLPARRAPLPP